MNSSAFTLDPRISAETVPVGDLALSRVFLSRDANYPWLMLVPRRDDLVELIDLDDAMRAQLFDEITRAGRALKAVTRCHKINIAAFGNVVPQLHIHVIARQTSDAAWPNPVWGKAPSKTYDLAARERLIEALRHALAL